MATAEPSNEPGDSVIPIVRFRTGMSRTVLERLRRHPALTFGAAGGGFALLFVLSAPVRALLAGQGFAAPPGLSWLLVAGGFLGGAALARLLWGRLGGEESPARGALVGGVVGLLALPVPFYLFELGLVLVGEGVFEPLPNASPVMQLLSDLLLFLFVPIFLGALGLIPTYGGTVVVGALVGSLLAQR